MIGKLLQQVEFKHVAAFASPAFLSVIPTGMLWREGKQLLANLRDPEAFRECKRQRQVTLEGAGLPVTVSMQLRTASASLGVAETSEQQQSYAHTLVALYFHQVFSDGPMLLDLRASSVTLLPDAGTLKWDPAPWFITWRPDFREALRLVYRGFYLDDAQTFERGLRKLGLHGAGALFRQHFGENPSRTRFKLRGFLDSFQHIFEYCKAQRIELKPEFVTLGIYLSTLYENLDRFDFEVDARSCFVVGALGEPRPSTTSVSGLHRTVRHEGARRDVV